MQLCNVLDYKWLIRLSALTIVNIKYQNQTSKCLLKVEEARGKHPEDILVITGGSKDASLLKNDSIRSRFHDRVVILETAFV